MRAVALLAEGVDRNADVRCGQQKVSAVALLAEGVDRNVVSGYQAVALEKSPSSRRAWIEMSADKPSKKITISRPPRGGRG